MFCPNEKAGMHQVGVTSHYGQRINIDQCEGCGGIWFDAFELFKVKLDEAQEIESLDSGRLRAPSDIDNPKLLCPRDRTALIQYKDPNFPKELILTRCPKCQGFAEEGKPLDTVLNVLMVLLRLFVFRS